MNYVLSLDVYGVPAFQIPCLTGNADPTTATEAAAGMLYLNTLTGALFKCTSAADGVYTWVNVLEGATIAVDSALNEKSVNPVQNKVVAEEIRMVREALEGMVVDSELSETSTNPVQNKAVTAVVAEFYEVLQTAIMPRLMPAVSEADNGKILQVANGAWAAVAIGNAEGGEY